MALSTITVGGQSVTLVDLPTSPGFRTVQFDFDDPAVSVTPAFSGQTQIQRWPGADIMTGTVSLPPMVQADADAWISFLMACRGQANAFLIGDPLKPSPRGKTQRSIPVVSTTNTTTQNLPGSDQLFTRGWSGSGRLLEPGDWIQIGYRLYRNLLPVISTDGTATLTIWPSLREQPADGTPFVLRNAKGLFRLGASKRTWNVDQTRLTTISFPIVEWRGPTSA